MYPNAPIYTSAYDAQVMPDAYRAWDIRTSFLQRLPWKRKTHRAAFLLYPLAFESFDLSEYDVVISSSSSFAKGIITGPHTTHVCYTHAPMRFAWTTRSYMEREKVSKPLRALLAPGTHYLRTWDAVASMRVDQFVANSSIVAKRIKKYYRADAEIIFPPVETDRFQIAKEIGDYYIIVSRAIPYKRIDLAIAAFTKLKIPLKIVGAGRDMKALQEKAGSNVQFMGRIGDRELPKLLSEAKGYIMPGEEDFGIAPVEANACGRPVIAFAAGGALDSQIDGVTGELFPEQTVDSLCEAVCRAENSTYDPHAIRAHAQKFDTATFQEKMFQIVANARRNTVK